MLNHLSIWWLSPSLFSRWKYKPAVRPLKQLRLSVASSNLVSMRWFTNCNVVLTSFPRERFTASESFLGWWVWTCGSLQDFPVISHWGKTARHGTLEAVLYDFTIVYVCRTRQLLHCQSDGLVVILESVDQENESEDSGSRVVWKEIRRWQGPKNVQAVVSSCKLITSLTSQQSLKN